MNTWQSIFFQNANSPMMEEFIFFYDHSMMIIIFFVSMVMLMMISMITNQFYNTMFIENHFLESVWTITPMISLLQVAFPSLMLLYIMDEYSESSMSIKAIGHQWYWSYEYFNTFQSFMTHLEFNAYMIGTSDLDTNNFRLLDTDNRVTLPSNMKISVLTTSEDVLHSWALPALSVKVDSCPGRLNQAFFMNHRPGVFFGQCSEICGANHSFMPIVVEFVSIDKFKQWFMLMSNSMN